MKYALGILCLSTLSAVLLAGSAAPSSSVQAPAPVQAAAAPSAPRAAVFAQAPAQDAQLDTVAKLEKQFVAANAQIGALTKELAETRALLDKTVAYLGQQALASRDLAAALDEAEAQGFAVGENFGSRKTLLAGWRKQLESVQAELPQRTVAATTAARPTPAPVQARKPVAKPAPNTPPGGAATKPGK